MSSTVPTSSPVADLAAATTLRIFTALSQGYSENFSVRLWTGETWEPNSGPAAFALVLKHPGALRAMFWPFDKVGLGESYLFDDFDIEGDIFAFTRWLKYIVTLADQRGFFDKIRLLRGLMRLPKQKNPRDLSKAGRPTSDHTRDHDREAIEYTYNLPVEFYQLFLDTNLQYTCGYFASPEEDIETAQLRKMHYICRKLRLKHGERFVDIGCGWGGLVAHAAKHYGVEAVGVTLSSEQAKCAERTVAEAGVADRVKIVLSDYRDLKDPIGFDKAASVGMAEHIGRKNLSLYMGKVYENLRPGGVYLHHCITLRPFTPHPRWRAFAKKYVFPNGDLQTIVQAQEAAARAGFEIRDVENLREHYVLTLENWVRKLEANREAVLKLVGEVSYRIFRIYLAGATMGFKHGIHALNQILLSKPSEGGCAGLPLTRAEWYA